jgi:hypothetical protein
MQSLLIGMGLTLGLALVWTWVQTRWKDMFREEYSDDDALAGRRSCSNCGCTNVCERKKPAQQETKKVNSIKKD